MFYLDLDFPSLFLSKSPVQENINTKIFWKRNSELPSWQWWYHHLHDDLAKLIHWFWLCVENEGFYRALRPLWGWKIAWSHSWEIPRSKKLGQPWSNPIQAWYLSGSVKLAQFGVSWWPVITFTERLVNIFSLNKILLGRVLIRQREI